MTTLSKDEVISLIDFCGLIPRGKTYNAEPYERFAALCRAGVYEQGQRDMRAAAAKVDWVEVMRAGQLVTWSDAGTLGYRVFEGIRALPIGEVKP